MKNKTWLLTFTRVLAVVGFIFFASITNGAAQTGYVYTDSSLLETKTETQFNNNETIDATDTVLYEHSIVISADTILSWKTDPKYAYVKNLDSLIKLRQMEEQAEPVSENAAPSLLQNFLSSGFIQVFFGAIAILVVLFILYKLFLNKGIFKRNSKINAIKPVADDEYFTDASDYDALIHQSYKLSDYRMAVRYLFLKTLRQLADKGLLQRSVDKTNFQYLQEIGPDKKQGFAALVLNYEYVWYGNLQLSQEQYIIMEKNYTIFYNKI